MADLPAELANLPPPQIVEEISYETRRGQFIERLTADFDAVGIDYDVNALETDPGVILTQGAAFADVNMRQRINEAVQAYMLPFARGGDLDMLAAFYDVGRLSGEADARLRSRTVLAIRGRSTGGTEPRYRSVAMTADVRVADAAIYTQGKDPTIRVAIFSTENGGVADDALLATVDAALQAPGVRMVNDTVVVAPASRRVTDVVARYWPLPNTSDAVEAQMKAALANAWARDMGLGRDVVPAWLTAKLMVDGLHNVEIVAPTGLVDVPYFEAAALGTVTLINAGRAY